MQTTEKRGPAPERKTCTQRGFPPHGGNRLWQRCRSGSPEQGSFFLGAAGLSMLLLSVLVALASATLSFWLVYGYVFRIARRNRSSIDSPCRIVVLGSCLDVWGGPTPTYRGRLARALWLHRQFPSAKIFLLGGRTGEEAMSEAAAGAQYLLTRGVPESSLVVEERSRHTLENLRFYRSTVARLDDQPDVLVTSRFHLARSSLLASGLGIPHILCGAEDRWSPSPKELLCLFSEAFFVHWYLVGRTYAGWTHNERMLDQIR
ncbi:YdcF family protein [Verrucomicrobium sp. 3C]|uniref:YdcF family protein n=1 Tax=Verrucomicrobium sp. 3C TaxID=1134055 RepID=UPI0003777368|nr:YdcF family protein [Verrucomicrobium sp. 3C]